MTIIEKIGAVRARELINNIVLTRQEREVMNVCFTMSSIIWAGTIDGRLACIWGLMPPTLLSTQAYLWLYTTDVVQDHQFIFVRHSQLQMEKMLEEYPTIIGHVIAGNDRSIRWLKWLGAEFFMPKNGGVPFRIIRHG